MATTQNITEIKQHPHFSEFTTSNPIFLGTKVSINDLLNKEILISGFKVGDSHYKTKKFATVQFTFPNKILSITEQQQVSLNKDFEKHIFFTGSAVILDQLTQNKDKIPFYTSIVKIQKYYTLT